MAAQVSVAAGDVARAREAGCRLAAELQIEPQAYAKLIEGEAALQRRMGAGRSSFLPKRMACSIPGSPFRSGPRVPGNRRFSGSRLGIRLLHQAPRRSARYSWICQRTATSRRFTTTQDARGKDEERGLCRILGKYLAIRGKANEDPLLAEAKRRNPQMRSQ